MKRFALACFLIAIISAASAQVISLDGRWKFHIGDEAEWATPTFNDTNWETIYAPSAWEDEGFNGYDGFAWYRIRFDGRKLSKDENYYLGLGYIDDCDQVFLNGNLIGFSGSMPPKFKTAFNNERKYNITADHIRWDGENVLSIRVYDVTLAGGLIQGRLGIYRAPRSHLLLDLQGTWDFNRTYGVEKIEYADQWKKIMVPSPWEHQGFPKYDGNAWYKKTFMIPDAVATDTEELVLLVGKIDDFDKTFLNGKQIGRTKDNRDFGRSQSFNQLRAYTIPPGLLKKGENVIEVFVEDMGNVGGIYEGPVGIATRSNYERYYRQKESIFWWGDQQDD
ncbi:MAG: beta galactosidase jelly roll domain-containing protein [Cyclobacteriaceae bacterium]|jgi:hypothetical protein